MKRKFYKIIRSEKTADSLNRLKLSSVYSKNCSEQKYVDVNDETLEELKSLARFQRRQDSKDYRNLSIYAYESITDTAASVEDEYIAKIKSAELRNALMLARQCEGFCEKLRCGLLAGLGGNCDVLCFFASG